MTEFVFYHETSDGDCPTYSAHKTETLEQAVRLFCELQDKYINDVIIGTVGWAGTYQKIGRLEVVWPGPTLRIIPPQRPPGSFATWTWCKEPAVLWKLKHSHAYGGSGVAGTFRDAEGWRAR